MLASGLLGSAQTAATTTTENGTAVQGAPLSRPARLVTFRVIQRPVAATEDIGALRANPGDEHCPVFSCIKHVTIVLSLVCACSSGAATEVGPCLARAGGSRALRARGKLHVLSGSGRESEEPPWPNGQGVGLLIRRLRVRVPQGVHGPAALITARQCC